MEIPSEVETAGEKHFRSPGTPSRASLKINMKKMAVTNPNNPKNNLP